MTSAYQLDKVIIFSRHGIRTALQETIGLLNQVSPLSWPTWDYGAGHLTTRGGALEAYFGHYFASWLKMHNLHINDIDNELYVYANSMQRTVATAQFFTAGAFAGQHVKIHHKYPIEQMDPIFNPVIQDSHPNFKKQILAELEKMDGSKDLIPAYKLLADILDYQDSGFYKTNQCLFENIPTQRYIEIAKEPFVMGPLAIGTAVADALILQHYSGFPSKQVAWGKITQDWQWQQIVDLRNHFISLLYNVRLLAKHLAVPLLKMIKNLVERDAYKVILLVGHDSNIASILGALEFHDYQLPEQFEKTPIGGKLVFQRFYHPSTKNYYFKAEYVYQSFAQLRSGDAISITNPPKSVELKLTNATVNEDGYYLWSDFMQRIKDNLQ